MASGDETVLVADAPILVRLLERAELRECGQLPAHHLVLVDQVRAEVEPPSLRAKLDLAVTQGQLLPAAISSLAALAHFARLARRLGRGEAACLALAAARGWHVLSADRRRFRREVERELGRSRLVSWADLQALLATARSQENPHNRPADRPKGCTDMSQRPARRWRIPSVPMLRHESADGEVRPGGATEEGP